MRSNVRSYSDKELLERVELIGGTVPNIGTYLLIGVQSQEDAFNMFDDKFYVFDGNKFMMVTSGTTNAGATAMKHFDRYGLSGAAVWKTDTFYKGLYKRGYHKASRRDGGMRALRQVQPIYFYRDSNKDNKIDETGKLYHDIIYANQHGVDYDPFSQKIGDVINGWSFACQVMNNMSDYRQWIKAAWKRNKLVDYALIKEF